MTRPEESGSVRRVLGVVGSLRRDSFNARLLSYAASAAPERLKIDIADRIIDLPLFDEDLEDVESGVFPSAVAAVHDAIRAADGIVIATPEYNFGVPGPMKNFVDWASRPPRRSPLIGKPIALMGASVGKTGGTVQCQGQLRVSLAVLGAHVLPWPPVLVGEAPEKFDADGALVDPMAHGVIGIALTKFLELIDALSPRSETS